MLIFKDFIGNIVTSIKAKKTFIYKSIFLKSLNSYSLKPYIIAWIAYQKITKKKIFYAFFYKLQLRHFGKKKKYSNLGYNIKVK